MPSIRDFISIIGEAGKISFPETHKYLTIQVKVYAIGLAIKVKIGKCDQEAYGMASMIELLDLMAYNLTMGKPITENVEEKLLDEIDTYLPPLEIERIVKSAEEFLSELKSG